MGALAGWGRRHTRVHAARPAVVCVIELIWKRAVERVRVSASRDSCSRWRLPGRPNSDSGAACVVAVSLRLAPTRRVSRFDGNTGYHHTDRSGANPVNLPVSKALGPSRREGRTAFRDQCSDGATLERSRSTACLGTLWRAKG